MRGQVFAYAYGAYLCYKLRNIDDKYSEVKPVSVSIINNLQTLLLAVPLAILVSSNNDVFFIIKLAVVVFSDCTVLYLLMGSRLYLMWRSGFSGKEGQFATSKIVPLSGSGYGQKVTVTRPETRGVSTSVAGTKFSVSTVSLKPRGSKLNLGRGSKLPPLDLKTTENTPSPT